jgi:hypothetical protein
MTTKCANCGRDKSEHREFPRPNAFAAGKWCPTKHPTTTFVPAPEEGTSGLLPCPFCGDDCACINYGHRNADSANARNVHFAAFCCGQLDDHATYEQARAEWNRRTAQPSVSASVAETVENALRDTVQFCADMHSHKPGLRAQRIDLLNAFVDAAMHKVRTALTGSPREDEQ